MGLLRDRMLELLLILVFMFLLEGLVVDVGRREISEDLIVNSGGGGGITLQGYITDIEGKEIEGAVLLGCTLWTDSVGGIVIWGGSDSIEVERGILNYDIPITNNMLGINEEIYIGLSINGESVGRVRVRDVIWSYRSIESETSDISKSTRSLNGGMISGELPNVGEVLKWDGYEWRPMVDEVGGVSGDNYLRDDIDTFGYLEGEGLQINRYSRLIDSVEVYSESLKTYIFTTRNNLSRKDPRWFSKFSNYYFKDLQDTNRYFYFNDGELKTTGTIYSKGILDSGNLYTTGRVNRFNYGLGIGYGWKENPDVNNDTLYNMTGLIVYHGNNYFYDDVSLISDPLSNNQSFFSLLDVTDSSYIRVKPKPYQSIAFRKQKTTSSVDLDSAWMILDRYSLKYMDYALQDSATKIGAGYGYFRDSVTTNEIKVGNGESVTEFIKVGSHAGIVFNGVDTFWLSKDTI